MREARFTITTDPTTSHISDKLETFCLGEQDLLDLTHWRRMSARNVFAEQDLLLQQASSKIAASYTHRRIMNAKRFFGEQDLLSTSNGRPHKDLRYTSEDARSAKRFFFIRVEPSLSSPASPWLPVFCGQCCFLLPILATTEATEEEPNMDGLCGAVGGGGDAAAAAAVAVGGGVGGGGVTEAEEVVDVGGRHAVTVIVRRVSAAAAHHSSPLLGSRVVILVVVVIADAGDLRQ